MKAILIKILVIGLIAGVGVGSYFYFKQQKATPKESYEEVKPSMGDVQVTVLTSGTVEPQNRLAIKPPISGRIETVLVEVGQEVKKGQILAWMSSTERSALLDSARAKGSKELNKWEQLYKPTPIISSLQGTVILRNVEPGQTFTSQDAVFVLSDRLTIKALVDETDIAQIVPKQTATVVLDAYPKEKTNAYVDKIAYDATTKNSVTSYIVDVVPETIPSFMRSGMTANVTFLVKSKTNILTVPNETIKTDGDAFYLQIKGVNPEQPEKRPIKVGITDGKKTEIIEGITINDVILIAKFSAESTKKGFSNPFMPKPPTGSKQTKGSTMAPPPHPGG